LLSQNPNKFYHTRWVGTALRFESPGYPENIVEVGQYYDGGGAYGIAVQNNIAFVADDNQGLEILEITGLFPTKVSNGYGVFSALIVIHIFVLFKLIKRKKR